MAARVLYRPGKSTVSPVFGFLKEEESGQCTAVRLCRPVSPKEEHHETGISSVAVMGRRWRQDGKVHNPVVVEIAQWGDACAENLYQPRNRGLRLRRRSRLRRRLGRSIVAQEEHIHRAASAESAAVAVGAPTAMSTTPSPSTCPSAATLLPKSSPASSSSSPGTVPTVSSVGDEDVARPSLPRKSTATARMSPRRRPSPPP